MATITLRMDDAEKVELDEALNTIGMSISAFYSIYTKRFLHDRKIPFEIVVPDDPFFSEKNQAQLRKANEQIDRGDVVVKTIEELEAMANA